jgi:isoleucyl-tRNA synthetase
LAKLKITNNKIEKSLQEFNTISACEEFLHFFEVLNNWYIRRSRSRFWKTKQDEDKLSAYNTLYTCLEVMTKAMSSLLPLISENIYLGLTGKDKFNSVHLEDFPNLDSVHIDSDLVDIMDQVLDICSIALFIRSEENIRVRQPLASLKIIADNSLIFEKFEDLIKYEINPA